MKEGEAGQGKDSKKSINPTEFVHERIVAKEGGDIEIPASLAFHQMMTAEDAGASGSHINKIEGLIDVDGDGVTRRTLASLVTSQLTTIEEVSEASGFYSNTTVGTFDDRGEGVATKVPTSFAMFK